MDMKYLKPSDVSDSLDKSFVAVVMDVKSTCLVILYKYEVSKWNSRVNLSIVNRMYCAAQTACIGDP